MLYAFADASEPTLLVTPEKEDATARYRLLSKLQGVCMRDIDEDGDYDDYRKAVDLEWSTKKIDEYGKKKGWLAVCELLSPYHDDLIAEADGDKESWCEGYTINDEFYKCVIAAPRELQKRTVLTREEHEAR